MALGKKRRSGRITTSQEQVEEITEFTAKLVARQLHKSDVKRKLRAWLKATHGIEDIGVRSVEEYISRARLLLIKETGKDKSELKNDSYLYYRSVVQSTSPDISTAERIAAQTRIDKIHGLEEPAKQHHTGNVGLGWDAFTDSVTSRKPTLHVEERMAAALGDAKPETTTNGESNGHNGDVSTLEQFHDAIADDPFVFKNVVWPDVHFYDKQVEIIRSVWDNDDTVVVAGNQLGKDFVAGFIIVTFFLTRNPCRVVTTSVRADHLRVLWGEIGRFIQTARSDTPLGPLTAERGGILICNHWDIRKQRHGQACPISYLRGMVSERGEGMAGHHAPHTLFVGDEASGLDDSALVQTDGWARKKFLFGNPNECQNQFRKAADEGDLASPDPGRMYRKVIQVKAIHSPNVALALEQQRRGMEPTNETILPGVLTWDDYVKRRRMLDAVRQCVGLDAEFYKGAAVLLYPVAWLDRAERIAADLDRCNVRRRAKCIGVDPGEGVAATAMAAVDELGLIELVSLKTPDTAVIPTLIRDFGRKHNVPPENWVIDRGGGGKQHADRLRRAGFSVRTVAFGEAVTIEPRRATIQLEERAENREERTTYTNRRAEMYGRLRILLDPATGQGESLESIEDSNEVGFGLPARYTELRRQMAVIPLLYDQEQRMRMLPKNKRDPDSKEKTLTELIGCSPDECDALVLAVFGMQVPVYVATAGAAG